jgi:hypothetical protein
MTAELLEALALQLTPEARARLAQRLLRSLETLSSDEIEHLWSDEALRRHEDMDSNEQEGRPAEDVFREARSRLA